MHSQKAESIGMCFLPQSESSPIITRHRRAAVQYLRDIPTRQRFGQHTGVRRRKYGRSGVSPNRNASLRASYAPVGFRLPLARPWFPSVHRANCSRRAAEQERVGQSAAVQYLRDIPTHQRFGQRTGVRRRKHGRSGVSPNRNTSARASYAPVGFRLPLIRPRFPSVHRANRSRRAAEQKRKSPRFIRSRRFPASTRPSALAFDTPREPFPARRRAETQVSALHTLPSVSGFHSPVRACLRYTARTVPGAPPSRNA